MCIQIAERYLVCRCLYYRHAIDACAQRGQRGHKVQEKAVYVGHSCPEHFRGDLQLELRPDAAIQVEAIDATTQSQSDTTDVERPTRHPLPESSQIDNDSYYPTSYFNTTSQNEGITKETVLQNRPSSEKTSPNSRGALPARRKGFISRWSVYLRNAVTYVVHEPPVQAGATRIRWTCECGLRLWDDYTELQPGALQRFAEQLRHNSEHASNAIFEAKAPIATSTHLFKAISRMFGSGKSQNNSALPQHSSDLSSNDQDQARYPFNTILDPHYLLLCIPFRRKTFKMSNVTVQTVNSDKVLFERLREYYYGRRKTISSLLSLRTVSSIRFVQFEVHRNELADINCEDVLPPETLATEYSYSPMPAEFVPPIGPNLLGHLFHNPRDASESLVCLTRIPKKLKERLVACPVKGVSCGWGISIEEGISWTKIWSLVYLSCFISLVIGSSWAVAQHDVQGGFGIASFVLAMGATAFAGAQVAWHE